nr:gamma-glutamyltranspeptidase 1-like [Danio rerio]|eukprot:XP_017212376.1 gamma-glutamyltranspeptidase 1-like [Danio rerio]
MRVIWCHKCMFNGNCYGKAAVATDAETCSDIGRDILQRGGSAVDAAIAALLCVSVINPQSIGIGGGVVFTIYNASTGKVETINARETAPMSATADMFDNNNNNTKPGLLIAVPGELRGYKLAHDRHGRLEWKELFKPSIKLARKGFKIGKALADAIKEEEDKFQKNTTLCEVFCDADYNLPKINDYIRFSQLAATYRKISEEGPDAFYNGSLTQSIVDDIRAAGGNITRKDLTDYEPVLTESAINFNVGKYIFHAPGAPFGGPVLTLIMKILLGNGTKGFSGFNLSKKSVSTTKNKTLTYHRIIETLCIADVEKTKLGDPLKQPIVNEVVKNMISDSFADHNRSEIDDSIATACNKSNNVSKSVPDDSGTSHVSVIDAEGNAVAVTSSINNYFGSGVMSECTGIIFNDQMKDFTDNEHNRIEKGKRPLSSMCPTIILDEEKENSEKVTMVVGAEGGTNITTAVAQVILNYLYFDYDLKDAVNASRVQIKNNVTNVEPGFDKDVIKGLEQKYHVIGNKTEVSVVQVIDREKDKVCAVSDHRKYGNPAGY